MKNIPPIDLTRQYQLIESETNAAVLEVLRSGRYIGGSAVNDFEQQFAEYVGVSECVACNSGTDALYLALRTLNIGAGDEVITTSFTFIATSEIIVRAEATPIFVDIDPDTYNLDIEQIESAITSKTKAIIPVHLFGQPTDMTKLMAIARSHHLLVIEDCAQATGASWAGEKVGSIGDVGCFSFFPTKNLGACGDGGAVTTNDKAIAQSIRKLKEHGMSSVRYCHDDTGLNSRLDTIQAVILQIKLRHLDRWNDKRSSIATTYRKLLDSAPGIKLPQALSGGESVWNQYTIAIEDKQQTNEPTRDKIRQQLQDLGVTSMVYYPIPLHLQPVYQNLSDRERQLPAVEKASREVLSLPMFPDLTFDEQQHVAYCLKDCL